MGTRFSHSFITIKVSTEKSLLLFNIFSPFCPFFLQCPLLCMVFSIIIPPFSTFGLTFYPLVLIFLIKRIPTTKNNDSRYVYAENESIFFRFAFLFASSMSSFFFFFFTTLKVYLTFGFLAVYCQSYRLCQVYYALNAVSVRGGFVSSIFYICYVYP